jgi:hypothetical protein
MESPVRIIHYCYCSQDPTTDCTCASLLILLPIPHPSLLLFLRSHQALVNNTME